MRLRKRQNAGGARVSDADCTKLADFLREIEGILNNDFYDSRVRHTIHVLEEAEELIQKWETTP